MRPLRGLASARDEPVPRPGRHSYYSAARMFSFAAGLAGRMALLAKLG